MKVSGSADASEELRHAQSDRHKRGITAEEEVQSKERHGCTKQTP